MKLNWKRKDNKKRTFNKTRTISLKNVSIGKKYGFTLSLILIFFVISSGIVVYLMGNIGEAIDAMERRGDRSLEITEMGSLARAKNVQVVSYAEDPNLMYIEEYEKQREAFHVLEEDIRSKMDSAAELELFDRIATYDKEMNTIFMEKIIPLIEEGNTDAASAQVRTVNAFQNESVINLEELREIVNDQREQAVTGAKDAQNQTLLVLLISTLASVVSGGLLVFLISRSVSKNLNEVVEISDQIADGNLNVSRIEYEGSDEIGRLADSVNTMGVNLKNMISQIASISETVSNQSEELTQSANEVRAGSEQVAVTMQELSVGSESQATNSSSLAESMNSFSSKVALATENGEKINMSSTKVMDLTLNGLDAMGASVRQMSIIDQIVQDAVEKVKGLDSQSQEITKLVSVIKAIADQTNLLALNAAIEAARAGEHGRGFAVVADEVRKLAEQVSVSVTDITGIVSSIQNESSIVATSLQAGYEEVEKGTSQIEATGDTFMGINQAVQEMVNNIKEMSASLTTMSGESQQMGGAIEEIAAVSEQAAAGIEQTSASSQQTSSSMEEMARSSNDLANLAEELNGLVRQFRL